MYLKWYKTNVFYQDFTTYFDRNPLLNVPLYVQNITKNLYWRCGQPLRITKYKEIYKMLRVLRL